MRFRARRGRPDFGRRLILRRVDGLRDHGALVGSARGEVKGAGVIVIAGIGLMVNIAVAWTLSRDRENINTRAAFVHVLGDLLGSVAAIVAGFHYRTPFPVQPMKVIGAAAITQTAGAAVSVRSSQPGSMRRSDSQYASNTGGMA